jgi:hypothetical protein
MNITKHKKQKVHEKHIILVHEKHIHEKTLENTKKTLKYGKNRKYEKKTRLRLITSLVDDTTSYSEEYISVYMWLKLHKRRKRKWIHDLNVSCAEHDACMHFYVYFF